MIAFASPRCSRDANALATTGRAALVRLHRRVMAPVTVLFVVDGEVVDDAHL